MADYQKYINALRKCAKEHDNDRTSMGHIIVSDLCRDTANLLEKLEQESKAEQFAKWVAEEIFDDNWEYNKDAFDELACRKLAKLGIVIRMGDEWELVEP